MMQTPKVAYSSGVYCFEHLPSGRKYIGSSVNLKLRFKEHIRDLNAKKHHNQRLQKVWREDGASAFKLSVLLYCDPKHVLFYEQRALDGAGKKFNVCLIAGNTAGVKASAETKAKLSAKFKGRVFSDEHKAKISAAKTNPSAETRAKMSAWQIGKVHSAETRAKISQANKGQKRKPHSPEARAKMSAAAKARTKSEEHLRKLTDWNRRKARLTPEQVREIRRRRRAGEKRKEVASWAGVSPAMVSVIMAGRAYAYVLDE